MIETNKIYQMDCLEGLKQMEDNSVDLVLTDPPYFNQGGQKTYKRKGKADVNTYFGEWDIFKDDKEYLSFINSVLIETIRVMKESASIYLFSNDRYCSYIRHMIQKKMNFGSTIIWHKYNSPPRFINFKKPSFISSKEIILFGYKGIPTFNKPEEFKEMLDVWITPQTPSGERMGHPTQKPISLMEKLAKISSNEGDLVLDPFMGSGTTAVACTKLGRNFIGFELEEKYVEIANKRIAQYKGQKRLSEWGD